MIYHDVLPINDICKWLPGKTDPTSKDVWLPSWQHMLDTALIIRKLYRKWLPDAERQIIQTGMDEAVAEQFVVLAALLHDMGKMTPVFVAKLLPFIPACKDRLESLGLSVPKYEYFFDPGKSHHTLLGAVWLRQHSCPYSLVSIIAAHHGKPLTIDQLALIKKEQIDTEHLYGKNGRDSKEKSLWDAARESWFQFALRFSGFASASDIPEVSVPAQMLVTGLVIMADWIASNQDFFPLLQPDEQPSTVTDTTRADFAWEELALPSPLLSTYDVDEAEFHNKFGFAPNALQKAVLDTISKTYSPGMLIIEAQMGVGKTEAALAAAEQYAERTKAGGVYFGLPTQATANGIFPRLLKWGTSISQEYQQAIRLAHGNANMNQLYMDLHRSGVVADEEGIVVHPWLEGRKKTLLSNFGIGTVDQLLMAALKQKHLMLRHLGLAGKIVVIDECHAYDAYMNVYLERALRWLGAYHVPVILLSATLPESKRCALMDAYLGSCVPGEWRSSRDYPLLTWSDGQEVHSKTVERDAARATKVRIVGVAKETISQWLKEQLCEGGCAVVILNTVAEAQSTAEHLRMALPEKEIMLAHSRYLLEDRAAWEERLLKRLGKASTPEERNGLIVVATQVVEQSLDIDADVMITELCPMDLLLQRLGRLHRHQRVRPVALEKACCAVLTPGSGSEKIYGEWLLQQTARLLPEEIVLPDDIPELVQDTYADPTGDMRMDPFWESHNNRLDIQRSRARSFVLKKPKESINPARNTIDGLLDTEASDSERYGDATVRDGTPSVEILMLMQYSDGSIGLVPWHESGRRVSAVHVPSHEEALLIARQRIGLTGELCRNINKTIAGLENITRQYVPEWQYSPMLHGELFLFLNEKRQARLGGYIIEYHPENGMKYWKEDCDGTCNEGV